MIILPLKKFTIYRKNSYKISRNYSHHSQGKGGIHRHSIFVTMSNITSRCRQKRHNVTVTRLHHSVVKTKKDLRYIRFFPLQKGIFFFKIPAKNPKNALIYSFLCYNF